MKIRTDFVTNSSSSSFVAVNISANTLQSYLKKNGLENIFEEILMPYVEWRALEAELEQSFAASLCNILKKYLEDSEWDDIGAEIDEDAIEALMKFIKKNKAVIDAEAEGEIELRAANGEDGYAYVQRLTYHDHKGTLVKWPNADGWNMQDGGGYEKIQAFNERMFDGEVEELAELAYDAIWDIVWDEEALAFAIEETGDVKSFDVPKAGIDSAAEEEFSLDDVEPVNTQWIEDALFVFTGLSEEDEATASCLVEDYGGIIKSSVVLKTNYVVYNPDYGHKTTKIKKAEELIERGKPIKMLTVSEFCKKLSTPEEQTALPVKKAEEPAVIPTTMQECDKIFKCYPNNGKVVINGIKKSQKEVVIPGVIDGMSVVVRQSAFNKDKLVEKVVFMEGVEELEADIFSGCKNLKEVVFASSIRKFGSGLFSGTPWLKEQGDWLIVNGILIKYLGNGTDIVIPDGVTEVADYAIYSNWSLKSLVIPDSVVSVGDSAFCLNSNLKEITIPASMKEFGKNPFANTAWEDDQGGFVIVNGTFLGFGMNYYWSVLQGCDTISIPEGVRCIAKDAFQTDIYDWNGVTQIELPDSLEVIGDGVFQNFRHLETIKIPTSVKMIGDNLFDGCEKLKEISIPDGVKSIGAWAFHGTAIEEMVLPDSVEELGNYAFYNCAKLKHLRLPKKLDVLSGSLLHSCRALEQVDMPEVCQAIENSVFESCVSLAQITIPNDVEVIGGRAFYGCERIEKLALPEKATLFGWASFKRCSALKSLVIPEGTECLREEMFEHCTSLECVQIPDSVQSISKDAFADCPKMQLKVGKGSAAEKFAKKNKIAYINRARNDS